MEQLTLEQAAGNHSRRSCVTHVQLNRTAQEIDNIAFQAGANWQKEYNKAKFQRLIKLVDSLVYYSQIHTVNGVRPANMDSHEKTWREAQKWIWDNCENTGGEYYLK